MTIESFKLEMRNQKLAFVSTKSAERLASLESLLCAGGARNVGPAAFAFSSETTPQMVMEIVGRLEAGECIYILSSHQGSFENCMLVPARSTGGITMQNS